jgi:hypothetical protein
LRLEGSNFCQKRHLQCEYKASKKFIELDYL